MHFPIITMLFYCRENWETIMAPTPLTSFEAFLGESPHFYVYHWGQMKSRCEGQTSHTKHGQNKSGCEKSIHLQEETFFLEMIPRDNVFQLRRSNIVQFRKSTTARNYQPFPKRTHASTPSVLIYTWQVVLDFNHQQYYLGYFIVFGVSLGLDLLVR